MNTLFALGLALLLLPVPLSFLIPTSPQASPDPSRVRRFRLVVVGFPLFVAIIQVTLHAFQRHLFQGPPPGGDVAVYGLFIWATMSWFFLGVFAMELRRTTPNPFPGHSRRSASLRARHAGEWITKPTWWGLRIVWLVTAAILLASAPDRLPSFIVLLAAGALLAMTPQLLQRSVLLPEPLLPETSEKLLQAYEQRRRIRARMTLTTCMVGVVSQTCLAALLGSDLTLDLALLWSGLTIVLLALIMAVSLLQERAALRRIGNLQQLAADGGNDSW